MPLTDFNEILCKFFLYSKLFNIRKLVIIKYRKHNRLRWEWSDSRSETQ